MKEFIERSRSLAPAHIGCQHQPVNRKELPGVLSVFSGQGAQWATMGRVSFSRIALFREVIDRCEIVLKRLPDRPD